MSNLIAMYYEGFAPGPEENEKEFLARVELTKKLGQDPSMLEIPKRYGEVIFEPHSVIPIGTSSKIYCWNGAVTFSCMVCNMPIPVILLPKKKRAWIGTKEILRHEKLHAMRIAFNDEQFEEIMAYEHAPSKLYRFFGPIFASNYEVFGIIFSSSLAATGAYNPLFAMPLLTMGSYLTIRLLYRLTIFYQARKKVGPDFPIHLLTDKEIHDLSHGNKTKIEGEGPRIQLIEELIK